MATPCFADLGKQAKDLFSKNYHFGTVKLETKTKTASGVEFGVNGTSDSNKLVASFETKQTSKDYRTTLKEKWTTDNTLTTEITVEDQFMTGLKLGVNGTFTPYSGKKSATLKSAYKKDNVHLNADMDFTQSYVLMHGAVVFNTQNYLLGAQVSFDPNNRKVTKANLALGYISPDLVLHTNFNGSDYSASVYQNINHKLKTGISVAWSSTKDETSLGLGCIYKLDNDSCLRAKINNNREIGLGLTHRLKSGVNLHLSTLIDGNNLDQSGHKFGLGIEMHV